MEAQLKSDGTIASQDSKTLRMIVDTRILLKCVFSFTGSKMVM